MGIDSSLPEIEPVETAIAVRFRSNKYETIHDHKVHYQTGYLFIEMPPEKLWGILSEEQREKILVQARHEIDNTIKE